jgi:hypothetical protein
VGKENRKYPRLAKPLDATWRGASGGAPCRVADISWGGCFVQSLAEPTVGERTTVSPVIDNQSVDLPGVVVYRERAIGFAIQFDPLTQDQVDVLKTLLGEPPPGVG